MFTATSQRLEVLPPAAGSFTTGGSGAACQLPFRLTRIFYDRF